MMQLHAPDLFAGIRKVNRNMAIYDKAINGSRGDIRDIDLGLYSTSDTLALTGVANRNKIIHKAFQAYEQLRYYLEIRIAKGLLDMDQTE